jgi:hypothetical protein
VRLCEKRLRECVGEFCVQNFMTVNLIFGK